LRFGWDENFPLHTKRNFPSTNGKIIFEKLLLAEIFRPIQITTPGF
jgi:hypothetical protein